MPGIFGNPIYVGVYAMFHVFFALFLFSLSHRIIAIYKNPWALFYSAGFLINLFILSLTLSRGPLIGFLFGVAVFWSWYALWGQKRQSLLMLTGIALLAFAVTFPFWKDSVIAGRIYSISQGLGADPSRAINWNIAWQAFAARPLLGWGSNNYVIIQQEFYNPRLLDLVRERFDRPHNKYLEVAVDAGALGLASYLSIFGVVAYALFFKRKTQENSNLPLANHMQAQE